MFIASSNGAIGFRISNIHHFVQIFIIITIIIIFIYHYIVLFTL